MNKGERWDMFGLGYVVGGYQSLSTFAPCNKNKSVMCHVEICPDYGHVVILDHKIISCKESRS